jgi:two-component system probable response regulator PhcQ
MTSKSDSAVDGRSRTILFVDDEPLSLKYFSASVGRYAKVLTANNPQTALEILAAEGDEISVVVSDERMPHNSGVSFLSSVRKSWPSTVRVLTSAYANIDNLQDAINDAGIHRFVPKPWDLDELCAAMQEALKAERSTDILTQPLPGPVGGDDAENANIALLAVLIRELAQPLDSLSTEALQLTTLTGTRTMTASSAAAPVSPMMASWSAQLRHGQIAASATQVQRDVDYCKSLADSIAELAEGLAGPVAGQTTSMAETAAEVLEQLAQRKSDRKFISLDARRDFSYAAPRRIMHFVLTNLLRSTIRRSVGDSSSGVTIELVPGKTCNEVRISAAVGPESVRHPGHEFERATRCALWAFGGELSFLDDENLSRTTISVRVPKAEPAGDVSPSH